MALVDLAPEFHYVSVPRLSPYSFLQAKTKNSSQYTMLAGPANIFLDNNFIAKVRNQRSKLSYTSLETRNEQRFLGRGYYIVSLIPRLSPTSVASAVPLAVQVAVSIAKLATKIRNV